MTTLQIVNLTSLLQFDYVCIHWYDVKAADFMTYAELWHNTFGKETPEGIAGFREWIVF